MLCKRASARRRHRVQELCTHLKPSQGGLQISMLPCESFYLQLSNLDDTLGLITSSEQSAATGAPQK